MRTFWESDTWMFLQIIGVAIVLFSLVIGGVFGFVALTQYNACKNIVMLDTQHLYHYDFWLGCIVQLDNGRWTSITNYQQIQLEEGK